MRKSSGESNIRHAPSDGGDRPAGRRSQPVSTLRGKLRLHPSFVPGRYQPRDAVEQVGPLEDPLEYLKRRRLPGNAWFERGRRFAITGDFLADNVAALYPKLGHATAGRMLDTALERGIEHVADAPEALIALFAELDHPPRWVSWERIEHGAAVMRRYANLSGLFLRLAFAQTYVNANAGTPLYMTGSLSQKTVARRLKETSKWRLELHQAGGLRRFGPAFKTTVRVRVLHSIIRLHLLNDPQWDLKMLGMPIPQTDMAGANIGMFLTHSLLLRLIGARITRDELRDVMHLWRYHGHVIGVADDLNPRSGKHLNEIGKLITLTTRHRFDPRAKTLTRATLNARLRGGRTWLDRTLDAIDIHASHAFYYLANGKKLYEQMGLEDSRRWLWFPPAIFPWVFVADSLRRLVPGGTWVAEELGRRYIERVLAEREVKNAPFQPYHMVA
jgi:hypothetical protein